MALPDDAVTAARIDIENNCTDTTLALFDALALKDALLDYDDED